MVAGKSASEYVKSLGASNGRIYVAPDAVDTDFFAERKEAVGNKVAMHRRALGLPPRFFLSVGRPRAGKRSV